MHESAPWALTNGIRQIATRPNLSVITSTTKEIAAGLMRRFERYGMRCDIVRSLGDTLCDPQVNLAVVVEFLSERRRHHDSTALM